MPPQSPYAESYYADAYRRIDRHIGGRIRALRRFRGWTLVDVGQRLDVSAQQIHKFETGSSRISAGQLAQVAWALDAEAGWFFDDMPSDLAQLPRRIGLEEALEPSIDEAFSAADLAYWAEIVRALLLVDAGAPPLETR